MSILGGPNFPYQWYWKADDNRVYSAILQQVVNTTDSGYIAFTDSGATATRWPEDDSGQQTNAALNAVINKYNLYLDPKQELRWYAGDVRWHTEVAGINTTTAPPRGIRTDADSQRKLATLAADYRSDLRTGTVQFKLADGSFVTADESMIAQFYTDMTEHINVCYNTEQTCVASIDAGTTTDHAGVDTFFEDIETLGLPPTTEQTG